MVIIRGDKPCSLRFTLNIQNILIRFAVTEIVFRKELLYVIYITFHKIGDVRSIWPIEEKTDWNLIWPSLLLIISFTLVLHIYVRLCHNFEKKKLSLSFLIEVFLSMFTVNFEKLGFSTFTINIRLISNVAMDYAISYQQCILLQEIYFLYCLLLLIVMLIQQSTADFHFFLYLFCNILFRIFSRIWIWINYFC